MQSKTLSSVKEQRKLMIAISSRALFDLTESHRIFEQEGVDAYCDYQITHEDIPLEPGIALTWSKSCWR